MAKDKSIPSNLVFTREKFKYDTIEDMRNDVALKIGDVVELNGYYEAGDGADHKRKIEAQDDGSGVMIKNVNDMAVELTLNKSEPELYRVGLYANIVHNGEVNVSWFGAKSNINEAQDAFFKKAYNSNSVKTLIFDNTYYVDEIILNKTKNFLGTNKNIAILKPTSISKCVLKIRKEVPNSTIGNFSINGKKQDGTNVDFGCNFHFFHYNSEFRNFDIINCKTGIELNECWSSIYRNFRIINCDTGIHFNNHMEPNLSEIDGNVNDNLFIRGIIQRCTNGIVFDRQKCFGLENSFKQIHFEFCKKAIYSVYFNQILSLDGISFENDDFCFYTDGTGVSDGILNLNNVMCIVGNNCTIPFFLNGTTGTFNINGFVSTTVNYSDYEKLQNIIKINKGKSANINLAYNFNEQHIARDFNLYSLNCNYINGITMKTSANSPRENVNNWEGNNIVLRGKTGWNTESKAEILFENHPSDYENSGINSFKLLLKKVDQYAIGYPSMFVRVNNTWKEGFRIDTDNMYVYGKRVMLETEAVTLNTPYMAEKMKSEGVYNDFISYMDEKTAYDKQQRKLEKDRQLAYEEAVKENPELTYEEFMSVQPMTLNLVEEPQPSDTLKKFMEKYL